MSELSQNEMECLLSMMGDAPKRETSEMSDLHEIEKLLSTQRQTDKAIAKKIESLQARLSLLEEGVKETADCRSQTAVEQENASLRTKNGELATEISKLLAENLALQEAGEKKSAKNFFVEVVYFVIVSILLFVAFMFGQYANERKHQDLPTVTVQSETLESFVARESQSLTADEREKLTAVADTILNAPSDTPAEMREAFRYERRKAGIDSPAFNAFVEKWTAKVESMSIEENVEAVRQVYESLLAGLHSFKDIPGEPVSSDIVPTEAKTPPPTSETTSTQNRIFRRR